MDSLKRKINLLIKLYYIDIAKRGLDTRYGLDAYEMTKENLDRKHEVYSKELARTINNDEEYKSLEKLLDTHIGGE